MDRPQLVGQTGDCGVEFHCDFGNPLDYLHLEDIGECGDDDLCIASFRERERRSQDKSKSFNGSQEARSSKAQSQSYPNESPVPEPPFQGLPNDYYKKQFKPDYPAELHMKQICVPKPPPRTKFVPVDKRSQHPKAVFIPSLTSMTQDAAAGPAMGDGGFIPEPSALDQNRVPPAVVSSNDEIVVEWLDEHNIQMMFEYFLSLCVIKSPDKPWEFISNLCDDMIRARRDFITFDNLPRILGPDHIEAIFRIYDRIENGHITVRQYQYAMEAMGLNRFSTSPEGWEENTITKDTFLREATEAIDMLLRSFMVYKPTEEQLKQIERERVQSEEADVEDEEEEEEELDIQESGTVTTRPSSCSSKSHCGTSVSGSSYRGWNTNE